MEANPTFTRKDLLDRMAKLTARLERDGSYTDAIIVDRAFKVVCLQQDALSGLTLSPQSRAWLQGNAPKALEQAQNAMKSGGAE